MTSVSGPIGEMPTMQPSGPAIRKMAGYDRAQYGFLTHGYRKWTRPRQQRVRWRITSPAFADVSPQTFLPAL
jgi:hypothetical protein